MSPSLGLTIVTIIVVNANILYVFQFDIIDIIIMIITIMIEKSDILQELARYLSREKDQKGYPRGFP